jgi:hypothetical protein
LVEKPEGKRPLGRPRRRWVDNIRMDLGEVGWGDVDWIGLAKDRNSWRALVNLVLNLGFHEMLGNYRVASRVVPSSIQLVSGCYLYALCMVHLPVTLFIAWLRNAFTDNYCRGCSDCSACF